MIVHHELEHRNAMIQLIDSLIHVVQPALECRCVSIFFGFEGRACVTKDQRADHRSGEPSFFHHIPPGMIFRFQNDGEMSLSF